MRNFRHRDISRLNDYVFVRTWTILASLSKFRKAPAFVSFGRTAAGGWALITIRVPFLPKGRNITTTLSYTYGGLQRRARHSIDNGRATRTRLSSRIIFPAGVSNATRGLFGRRVFSRTPGGGIFIFGVFREWSRPLRIQRDARKQTPAPHRQ